MQNRYGAVVVGAEVIRFLAAWCRLIAASGGRCQCRCRARTLNRSCSERSPVKGCPSIRRRENLVFSKVRSDVGSLIELRSPARAAEVSNGYGEERDRTREPADRR